MFSIFHLKQNDVYVEEPLEYKTVYAIHLYFIITELYFKYQETFKKYF